MATASVTKLIQQVRTTTIRHNGANLTDEQLLSLYAERRDEAAFEAIVRRHGPMAMGVCRRVLADRHEAEDAFQATFLVLVRKARAIESRKLLANWLYGVAYNVALKARAVAAKRRLREMPVAETPERPAAHRPDPLRDLLPLLDQELTRLPEKYRLPIVLCDLEGKAHKEAAQHLGWPIGTVSGRLSRGRKMLARRLARYGFNPSAGSLAGLLCHEAASAAVPSSVLAATLKGASHFAVGPVIPGVISAKVVSLTEGVLKSMLLTKIKIATQVLFVGTLLGVGGAFSAHSMGAPSPAGAGPAQNRGPSETDSPKDARRNILQNAGMEEGSDSPVHWSQGADIVGVEYIWDKQVGHKSKSSLCLHKTANRYFPIAQWYQIVDKPGDASELRVSAQVKAQKVTKAIVDVIFLDANDEMMSHQWAAYIGAKQAGQPPANHDWKEYSGQVKIPQGTKKVQVALQIYGPGKVWFDDVRAEPQR